MKLLPHILEALDDRLYYKLYDQLTKKAEKINLPRRDFLFILSNNINNLYRT